MRWRGNEKSEIEGECGGEGEGGGYEGCHVGALVVALWDCG